MRRLLRIERKKETNKLRVLCIGGAGFIGSHLVERLVERGDDVSVLDNLSAGNLKNLDIPGSMIM